MKKKNSVEIISDKMDHSINHYQHFSMDRTFQNLPQLSTRSITLFFPHLHPLIFPSFSNSPYLATIIGLAIFIFKINKLFSIPYSIKTFLFSLKKKNFPIKCKISLYMRIFYRTVLKSYLIYFKKKNVTL